MRFGCEGRDATTIYFDLHQRTLRYEVYFLPDPPRNHLELYQFLLRRNHTMYGARFSIGPDGDLYLVGPRRARAPHDRGARPHHRRAVRARRALVPARGAPRLPRLTVGRRRRGRNPAADLRDHVRLCQSVSVGPDGGRHVGPRCRRSAPVRGSAGAVRAFLGPSPSAFDVAITAPSCRTAMTVSLAPVTRLALLGGGRMGEALVAGLLDAGWDRDALAVAEVDGDRRRALESRFPAVRVVPSPAWAAADADVLVVAVKPDDVGPALESCAASLPAGALVLSIAAGVTLAEPRGGGARSRRRARDAQHRRARPAGRGRDRAGPPRHRRAPRARRACARRGRHRRARAREAARRGHRAVGLGPGVRVPRRRGDDRGGRARRPAARHRGRARAPDAARFRRRCSATAARLPKRCAPRSRRRGAPPRPVCRCSRSTACAPRSSTRSKPRPTGRASSAGPATDGTRPTPGDHREVPVSRRPRRHRPPLLDDPATAPRAPAPAGPAEPRPRTPREQLVAGRVAGPHVHLSREGVLQQARALLRGDPRATLGLVEPGAVTLDDVRAAVAATLRLRVRHTARRDRSRLHDRRGRARDHAVCSRSRSSGGRIAFATGRPASLLVHYQQLARAAQHAGADVVALEQYGPFRATDAVTGTSVGSTASRC